MARRSVHPGCAGRGRLQHSERTASPGVMTGFWRCNRHADHRLPVVLSCRFVSAQSSLWSAPSRLACFPAWPVRALHTRVEALCGACHRARGDLLLCKVSRVAPRRRCRAQPTPVARPRPISTPATCAAPAPQAPSPRVPAAATTDRRGATARSEHSAHPSSRDSIVSPPAAARRLPRHLHLTPRLAVPARAPTSPHCNETMCLR